MTTQREKDITRALEIVRDIDDAFTVAEAFSEVRKELFARLRKDASGWDLMRLNGLAKEYGL